MKSMTFNILCAGKGENHWVFRQKLVKEIIKKYAPDTFGLQEVHYAWMRYLINQFKDTYDFVGVGKAKHTAAHCIHPDGGELLDIRMVFQKLSTH